MVFLDWELGQMPGWQYGRAAEQMALRKQTVAETKAIRDKKREEEKHKKLVEKNVKKLIEEEIVKTGRISSIDHVDERKKQLTAEIAALEKAIAINEGRDTPAAPPAPTSEAEERVKQMDHDVVRQAETMLKERHSKLKAKQEEKEKELEEEEDRWKRLLQSYRAFYGMKEEGDPPDPGEEMEKKDLLRQVYLYRAQLEALQAGGYGAYGDGYDGGLGLEDEFDALGLSATSKAKQQIRLARQAYNMALKLQERGNSMTAIRRHFAAKYKIDIERMVEIVKKYGEDDVEVFQDGGLGGGLGILDELGVGAEREDLLDPGGGIAGMFGKTAGTTRNRKYQGKDLFGGGEDLLGDMGSSSRRRQGSNDLFGGKARGQDDLFGGSGNDLFGTTGRRKRENVAFDFDPVDINRKWAKEKEKAVLDEFYSDLGGDEEDEEEQRRMVRLLGEFHMAIDDSVPGYNIAYPLDQMEAVRSFPLPLRPVRNKQEKARLEQYFKQCERKVRLELAKKVIREGGNGMVKYKTGKTRNARGHLEVQCRAHAVYVVEKDSRKKARQPADVDWQDILHPSGQNAATSSDPYPPLMNMGPGVPAPAARRPRRDSNLSRDPWSQYVDEVEEHQGGKSWFASENLAPKIPPKQAADAAEDPAGGGGGGGKKKKKGGGGGGGGPAKVVQEDKSFFGAAFAVQSPPPPSAEGVMPPPSQDAANPAAPPGEFTRGAWIQV